MKRVIIAHSKPDKSLQIGLRDVAEISQFSKMYLAIDWHFSCYIVFVNGLEARCVVLRSSVENQQSC